MFTIFSFGYNSIACYLLKIWKIQVKSKKYLQSYHPEWSLLAFWCVFIESFPWECVCVHVHTGSLSIHIYRRHIYLKSLSPSVHCRTKSVLPMKMDIRCYINKNDMIFNVISLFHIVNHVLKDFCSGHIISKSSSILILKAPHFLKCHH